MGLSMTIIILQEIILETNSPGKSMSSFEVDSYVVKALVEGQDRLTVCHLVC